LDRRHRTRQAKQISTTQKLKNNCKTDATKKQKQKTKTKQNKKTKQTNKQK
jgi:hypothetical protein